LLIKSSNHPNALGFYPHLKVQILKESYIGESLPGSSVVRELVLNLSDGGRGRQDSQGRANQL
jgi:hypothetical protein